MNQILMTENNRKNKSTNTERASIIRFFAIALIVFGIFIVCKGSYAIYKENKGENKENLPIVNMARVNDTVEVKINSVYNIENFIYSWNTAEETIIPVNSTYVEESILLPMENSTLNIKIEDETGRVIRYTKEFLVEGLDLVSPSVQIEREGNEGNIKITATDDIEMAYITYKINEGQEIKINRLETENTTMNCIVNIPRGENKVIVKAVDLSGNVETVEKTVIVSEKSKIRAEVQSGKITFIIQDEDGVRDVEVNLNGVINSQKDINQKEVRVTMELRQGVNTMSVKVVNVNSLETTVSRDYTYGQ